MATLTCDLEAELVTDGFLKGTLHFCVLNELIMRDGSEKVLKILMSTLRHKLEAYEFAINAGEQAYQARERSVPIESELTSEPNEVE